MFSLYVGDIVLVDVAYVFWLPPNERSKHLGPDPERRRWEKGSKSLQLPINSPAPTPSSLIHKYMQTHT